MKSKKLVIISLIILLILGSVGVFYFFNNEDKTTSLSLIDKQWIESNKNDVVDLSIFTGVNVLSDKGEGIVFDFLDDLKNETTLTFNNVAYQISEQPKTDYAFKLVDKQSENQLLLYRDNEIILSKESKVYSNIEEIKSKKIGVLKGSKDRIDKYLPGNTIEEYDTYDVLLTKIEDGTVELAIVPKLIYLNLVLSNENISIAYNITDVTNDYVLNLGSNERLNEILTKYFKNWRNNKFEKLYNKYMYSSLISNLGIDEKEKADFKGKSYTYGYSTKLPYDTVIDNKFLGINNNILTKFSDLTEIEIIYKKYNSYEDLKKAFNNNEIDFFFNTYSDDTFEIDNQKNEYNLNEKAVVLTNKNITINSIETLSGELVLTIKNTAISKELQEKGINVKEFSNLNDIISSSSNSDIIVIDSETYNYYVSNKSLKYKNVYTYQMNSNYGFVISNKPQNEIFTKLFDAYLRLMPANELITNGYNELINVKMIPIIIKYISIALAVLISICLIIYLILTIKNSKAKKEKVFTKEDKLRYIDMLTSLKNRNYLNDNLQRWDNSEIYPQAIVIIDLNNIAYINDNYGHEEGDKIIGEAANILIKSQLANTDIMRTNGNEFLIYMVSYDEKQVVSYTKKLSKEFKELSHKFGAAIGYSMIFDGIKTIDDAINEATLDMKSNKEEANN